MPKLIAIVGAKHSGKTTTIEHLITELTQRGYRVGTIKEMVRIPTLDTPQTETDRYRKAGAESVVAVPRTETVLFISKRLSVKEILPHLQDLDYVLLEGFESEAWLPKIVAAKTAEEAHGYFDGSVFAVSGLIADTDAEKEKIKTYPVLSSVRETKKLADITEAKALVCPV
jgi:molybdopterin-guanine dinucleotide biosynthesis adapter protein